jgi:hypothetical protein
VPILSRTYVILVGIDSLGVECLFPDLLMLLDVLTHPYVSVDAKDDIYPTRERKEVGFQSSYKCWRNCDELAISEL